MLVHATVDKMTAAPLDDPWPNFCRPPHCKKLAPNLSEELGRMGTRLQAVASIVNLVLPDLPRGTDEIRFYASEIPGTFWPSVPGPPSLP